MYAIEVAKDGVAGVACQSLDAPYVDATGGKELDATNSKRVAAPRRCTGVRVRGEAKLNGSFYNGIDHTQLGWTRI